MVTTRNTPRHDELAPGERVLFVASPHWTGILPGILFLGSLFIIPITLSLLGFYRAAIISFLVLAIAIPLAVLQLLATRRGNRLTVTNQRMICAHGFFDHEHRGIPIGYITNVTTHHDLLQKILGTGTVKVDVAGAIGPEVFPNLPDPNGLAELLIRLVDGYQSDVANEPDEEAPQRYPQHLSASGGLDEIERLHKLLTSGAITEDEYDDAKSKLLERL
jgi:membrane protein YdbS with pleckstrin-like domain